MHALHRTDDIVNLGVVRFSIFALRHKLAQVDGIARWQLRVTRHDFKPKAVLVVEPAEGRGNGQLMKEILSAALQWEPIRLGCDHSLIARPEVRLMDSLQEGRTSSGQLRHLTYEDM
jgi:hypothetical protein